MVSLRDLQLDFARGVFNEDSGIERQIKAHGLSGKRRLQVYRNNMRISLTEALQAIYPVIQRLVGDEFFRYCATQYIFQHPSTSGNLHDFGRRFPEFLRAFEPAAGLVYLPDVAGLEWARHRVFHAADHPPLDLAALGCIPPERYEALTFRLHPASRLPASDYPILRIWQVNQKGYDGDQTVNLAEGGVRLLVIRRPDLAIEIQILSAGEFALLQALAAGRDFAGACEEALIAQPDLDVAACFRHHVARGTVVDFTL